MRAEKPFKSDNDLLDDLARKIDDLPVLPQVLVKILQLNSAANDYFEQFEQLAKEDPAFAVRVVALANSAASAPVVPIVTILDALTRMGADTVRGLVASLAVQRVFMPTEPGQIRLWTHSIRAAVATQKIAQLLPQLKIESGQAYLAGLLHDIGRFVMLEHTAPSLNQVDESLWTTPEELLNADYDVYKFTHSELGYRACKHWGLPDQIARVVQAHHDELDSGPLPRSLDATTYCVQVADRLCMALLEHAELESMSDEERFERVLECCEIAGQPDVPIDARQVEDSVRQILSDSDQLLAGLGFATR